MFGVLLSINIIKCGGSNPINQDREQWTDGANALAIDNGVIILYTRNTHTINELKEFGYNIASTSSVISNPDIITGVSKPPELVINKAVPPTLS